MKIVPTPVTAALAGIVAALAWPWLRARFGGAGSGDLSLIVTTLLVIALPAHAFVVGFDRTSPGAARLDAALLKRLAAWVVAAVVTSLAMKALAH